MSDRFADGGPAPSLGKLLRFHRERMLLSQEELADRARVSVRTIANLEANRVRRPRGASVRQVADALGLSGPDRAAVEQAAQRRSGQTVDIAPPDDGPEPARSRPARPRPAQLPAGPRDFVGRQREIDELNGLARQHRREAATGVPMYVLSGTAGVGKTALAVRWAHQLRPEYPDGELFVDLRGFSVDHPRAPADALARLLTGLGVAPAALPYDADDRAGLYRSTLAGRRMIIVLDNAFSADQVRPLIPGSGGCLVLITSRHALGGLVAAFGARRIDLDVLPVDEARAMLVSVIGERARAEPEATDRLVDQCARLPLALRVAAVLAVDRRTETLATLAAELTDIQKRLDVLAADGDQGTAVASVLSWSYRHLPVEAAHAFRLLGLHPGPDADAAALAALAQVPEHRARRSLRTLEANNLVYRSTADRYWMHDLLHAYARRLAHEVDGAARCDTARAHLFSYYATAVTHAADMLAPGRRPDAAAENGGEPVVTDAASARAWLDTERPVLANPAFDPPAEASIQLSRALWRYLYDGGHTVEADVVHHRALSAARATGDVTGEAVASRGLAAAAWRWGQLNRAHELAVRAVQLAGEAGDEVTLAQALSVAGGISGQQSSYEKAEAAFRQALLIYRRLGDRQGEASTLLSLGIVHERRGNYDEAADRYERAGAMFAEIGDPIGRARTLTSLGVIAHNRRQDVAGSYYREAISLLEGGGNPVLTARCLAALADEHLRRGHIREAFDANDRALALFREVGDRVGEGWASIGNAEILLEQGETAPAMDRFATALALFQDAGDQLGVVESLAGLGDCLLKSGRPAEAGDRYHEAGEAARATGVRQELARCLVGVANAAEQGGDPDTAVEMLTEALAVYRELGMPEADQIQVRLAARDGS